MALAMSMRRKQSAMRESSMFEVYCLTSPSGKRYVGFTSRGADWRWREHVKAAKSGRKLLLYSAIRKYGAEAFSLSLLERMTTEAGAKRAEQLWIKELGTFGPCGYNLTFGGEGTLGCVASDETRAKMSNTRSGKKHTPEWRAKLAEAQRGKRYSPESRAKMSEAHRGKKQSPVAIAKTAAANRGRKHTPETRARMSEVQLLRRANERLENAQVEL
jgi:group I intron endonuclease